MEDCTDSDTGLVGIPCIPCVTHAAVPVIATAATTTVIEIIEIIFTFVHPVDSNREVCLFLAGEEGGEVP